MKSSLITREQLIEHLNEAFEIVDIVKAAFESRRFHILSVGIAGASLIRTACEAMHGDLNWWCSFLRNGPDDFMVAVDRPPNIPRGGGDST